MESDVEECFFSKNQTLAQALVLAANVSFALGSAFLEGSPCLHASSTAEKDADRQRKRETEREGAREGVCVCVRARARVNAFVRHVLGLSSDGTDIWGLRSASQPWTCIAMGFILLINFPRAIRAR